MTSSLIITMYIGLQILNIPESILPGWLNIFKEYPILNQGTFEGVKDNFKKFSQEPHCTFLIAQTNDHTVIAIATGIPLLAYSYEAELFEKNNLDPSDFFHINDVIVLSQYQNKGIGSKLYKKLEKKARFWGYKKICLCTVERKEDHPLKPTNFKDPAIFWQRLGFSKTSLTIKESWPTIMDEQGTVEMHENTLTFWTKELNK